MQPNNKKQYLHWIGEPGSQKKYWFKTFKVYWAYRWYSAKQLDEHMAKTKIKHNTGYRIEKTNYADKY